MGIRRNNKKSFFIPSYDELSLFMMSTAFLLVLFLDSKFRGLAFKELSTSFHDDVRTIGLVVLLGAGLLLPIYHIFTEREKSQAEKKLMLAFAVVANAFCGITASAHILDESADTPSIFMLLPIWNIINCVILLILFRIGVVNEDSISDEDVRPFEALLGFIVIVGVFTICEFVFKLYWAITFSICVIYATSFSDALGFLFHREGRAAIKAAKAKGAEICGYCERPIMKDETAWVINRNVVVCNDCYERYGKSRT